MDQNRCQTCAFVKTPIFRGTCIRNRGILCDKSKSTMQLVKLGWKIDSIHKIKMLQWQCRFRCTLVSLTQCYCSTMNVTCITPAESAKNIIEIKIQLVWLFAYLLSGLIYSCIDGTHVSLYLASSAIIILLQYQIITERLCHCKLWNTVAVPKAWLKYNQTICWNTLKRVPVPKGVSFLLTV